jgi:D-alanyl-lipoteichoic acid acyltransferase DltB (MBOAT superfamily)
MKFLKIAIVVCALLFLVGIILLVKYGWGGANLVFLIWGINAVVIIIGVLFERGRYKTKNTTEEGWVRTKERFIDHTSGKLVEVYFHPKTGERKYIDAS